jgi:succinyl-diaminopimelate desuccinylase
VIPASIEVIFNLRFSTEITVADIKSRCESILQQHGLRYDLTRSLSGEPFLTEPGGLLDAIKDSIQAVTGLDPEVSTGGGTSDGRFIAPTGAQVVELGHINSTIHQYNERVSIADIPTLTAIYLAILKRLLPAE